jgi:hypothetical protein
MVEDEAMLPLMDAQEDDEPSESERVRDELAVEDSAISSSSLYVWGSIREQRVEKRGIRVEVRGERVSDGMLLQVRHWTALRSG